jgi:hypothetical protein
MQTLVFFRLAILNMLRNSLISMHQGRNKRGQPVEQDCIC